MFSGRCRRRGGGTPSEYVRRRRAGPGRAGPRMERFIRPRNLTGNSGETVQCQDTTQLTAGINPNREETAKPQQNATGLGYSSIHRKNKHICGEMGQA